MNSMVSRSISERRSTPLADSAASLRKRPRAEKAAGRAAMAAAVILLVGMLALLLAGDVIAAERRRPHGTGTLTEVRRNGVVIIRENTIGSDGSQIAQDRGYPLSPRALVLDSLGRKTTLDKFTMPTVVKFEYIYTPNGPEIRLIREVAQ